MFSRASDIIGRRNAFVAAFVIFFGFSLGCGFARSLSQLIAFRALQGVGGSGLYSLTMVMWPELAPQDMKQYIAGLAGAVIAVAGVLGPVLGGVLTHYASWRWVFWINGPVGAASAAVFVLAWPKAEHLPDIERRSWRSLDWAGSFLLVAAAVLVTFPFQNAGGDADQWDQAVFVAPLMAGILCWVGLFAWEWFIERRWKGSMLAAFPLRLLRNRVYASAMIHTMFMGFPFIMVVYAFPLRLQVVNGQTPLLAGVMLLPMLAGVSIGSFVGGAVSRTRNRISETLIVATSLMLLGVGLESTLSGSYDIEAKALGFLPLIGLGFGLSASSSTVLASIESPIADHAPAQGIIAQVRILGGSLGIAASSAILAVQEQRGFAGIVSPEAASAGTSGLTPVQAEAVRAAFADAFTKDMRVCAAVVGVGMIFALGTMRRHRPSILEMEEEKIRVEKERRRASRMPVLDTSSG